jgi:hypothetical protein
MGFALGAALADVVANANGSPVGAADDAMMRQALGAGVLRRAAAIACLASLRLYQLRKP